MARILGGAGIAPQNTAVNGLANEIYMQAGQAWLLSQLASGVNAAGTFRVVPGLASRLQVYDGITGIWRAVGAVAVEQYIHQSDGNMYRIANQSGCAIGAYVTAKGANYTSPPSVVPSAGNSVWAAVVGGVLTGVTITNGGSGYQFPPLVLFDAPPGFAQTGVPGFLATGYATLTNGAVSAITLNDQGAGYTSPPNVYIIPDPRDATGAGATATAAVGGAGQLSGVVCLNHGNPITGTVLPTLTISGGGGSGGAATVIMDWAITAVTVTGGGTGYPASSEVEVRGLPPLLTGAAWNNPTMETNLLGIRKSEILLQTSAGGVIQAGGSNFGGSYPAAVTAYAVLTNPLITGSPTLSFTMGGIPDVVQVFQQ